MKLQAAANILMDTIWFNKGALFPKTHKFVYQFQNILAIRFSISFSVGLYLEKKLKLATDGFPDLLVASA